MSGLAKSKGLAFNTDSSEGGGGAGKYKMFDPIKEITVSSGTATATLESDKQIYKVAPSSNFTFAIDITNLKVPSNSAITFYLLVDMTNGTYDITWGNNVQWGNTSPTTTAMVKYLFAFTSFDGGTNWVGNQCYSWQ